MKKIFFIVFGIISIQIYAQHISITNPIAKDPTMNVCMAADPTVDFPTVTYPKPSYNMTWSNPLLNKNSYRVNKTVYNPVKNLIQSELSGGIYLNTQHMDMGAYSGSAGGDGFGGGGFSGGASYNSEQSSYNGGSITYSANVSENDNKASGGWKEDICPVCLHIIYYQKNKGAQGEFYDKPNGSTKHICQGHPDTPVGDISLGVCVLFFSLYAFFKMYKKYKKSLI